MSGGEHVLLDFLRTRPPLEAIVAAPRGRFLERCESEGVSTRRLRAPTELRRTEHAAWPVIFAARYSGAQVETTTLLTRERPDVVHANNFAAGIYAALPARLARVPMVWQIHDIFPVGSLEARVLRRVGPAARCIVAVSNVVRDSLLGIGIDAQRIVTISNAVDGRFRFDPARHSRGTIRSELGIPKEAAIITMIGQVAEHKGSGLMIEAVKRLRKSADREVRMVVVGAAPPQSRRYEEKLQLQAAASPGLGGCVMWLGYRTDIPALLADSDVVVNASLVPEAFGMTVLEGMAMAKIVIAPNAGGTAEIVEHGTDGFLVPAGDVEALYRMLDEIVRGLDRLGDVRRRARRKALEHYDLESKSDAMVALYERIVDTSQPSESR